MRNTVRPDGHREETLQFSIEATFHQLADDAISLAQGNRQEEALTTFNHAFTLQGAKGDLPFIRSYANFLLEKRQFVLVREAFDKMDRSVQEALEIQESVRRSFEIECGLEEGTAKWVRFMTARALKVESVPPAEISELKIPSETPSSGLSEPPDSIEEAILRSIPPTADEAEAGK